MDTCYVRRDLASFNFAELMFVFMLQVWFQNRRAKWRKREKAMGRDSPNFLPPGSDSIPIEQSSLFTSRPSIPSLNLPWRPSHPFLPHIFPQYLLPSPLHFLTSQKAFPGLLPPALLGSPPPTLGSPPPSLSPGMCAPGTPSPPAPSSPPCQPVVLPGT